MDPVWTEILGLPWLISFQKGSLTGALWLNASNGIGGRSKQLTLELREAQVVPVLP